MVIAGIDEAGYGPVLGPLCVGVAAFEVEDESCLWKKLHRAVSSKRDASGRTIHVADSKKVFSTSTGLAQLERSVLCFALTLGWNIDTLPALLQRAAPHCFDHVLKLPWYLDRSESTFPIQTKTDSLRIASNVVRREMESANTSIVHLSAYVIDEKRLNQLFQSTHNKSSTSMTFVARHIQQLLSRFADRQLTIWCDRQGGRTHYALWLRQMFEDWSLTIELETETRAQYMLSNRGRDVRLIFCEKGEDHCMSVALASMLAKYLREALMDRFNAYWKSLQPDLKATAGYHTDGIRFLRDIEPTIRSLGMAREELARSR